MRGDRYQANRGGEADTGCCHHLCLRLTSKPRSAPNEKIANAPTANDSWTPRVASTRRTAITTATGAIHLILRYSADHLLGQSDDRLDGPIGRTISMLFTQQGLQLLEATGRVVQRGDRSVALLGGEREPSLATVGCRQDSGRERCGRIVGCGRRSRGAATSSSTPSPLERTAFCAAR